MSWNSLSEAPLVRAISESIAVFAAVESAHIVFIAMLGGSVLLGGLAAAGFRPVGLAPAELLRGLRWPYRIALVGAALTGALLFATAPQKYLSNPLFATKFALLAAALLAHQVLARAIDGGAARPRGYAAVSLSLWLATITAGRWIGLI